MMCDRATCVMMMLCALLGAYGINAFHIGMSCFMECNQITMEMCIITK